MLYLNYTLLQFINEYVNKNNEIKNTLQAIDNISFDFCIY